MVIKIIRESANIGDDEEEIDLEIGLLDTVTQRKLQRFVMKGKLFGDIWRLYIFFVRTEFDLVILNRMSNHPEKSRR
jgi:hypothetical protein